MPVPSLTHMQNLKSNKGSGIFIFAVVLSYVSVGGLKITLRATVSKIKAPA